MILRIIDFWLWTCYYNEQVLSCIGERDEPVGTEKVA